MKKLALFTLVTLSLAAVSFSMKSSETHASPVAAANVEDVVPVEESMHEFMEYVFQPAYQRLKPALATAPTDNKGWKAIKGDALTLAESCNLLFGRAPEENAADWKKHAAASRDGGGKLYAAAKAKDFAATQSAWKGMLESCNACHRQFENGKHILQP